MKRNDLRTVRLNGEADSLDVLAVANSMIAPSKKLEGYDAFVFLVSMKRGYFSNSYRGRHTFVSTRISDQYEALRR